MAKKNRNRNKKLKNATNDHGTTGEDNAAAMGRDAITFSGTGGNVKKLFFGETLNLLEFCLRAVGEWQNIDPNQGRVLNVEKNFPVVHPDGELNFDIGELILDACKQVGDPTKKSYNVPAAPLMDCKCTRITIGEMHNCEDTVYDVGESKWCVDAQTVGTFIDMDFRRGDAWMYMERDPASVGDISVEDLELFYWISKLAGKDFHITVAVLNAISFLAEMMEFKYWVLPNGEKIPIKSLELRMLEVVPTEKFLIRNKAFCQAGPYVADTALYRQVADVTQNITILRIDENFGPIYPHIVLNAPLSNGRTYIIDPTSMQFNYRGPKGSVIMHGEWKEYVEQFPGKIVEFHKSVENDENGNLNPYPTCFFKKTLVEEAYWLNANLFKYFDCRICNYCGQVEKPAELQSTFCRNNLQYKDRGIKLLDCGGCKSAAYCGKFCQTAAWKSHKAECKKLKKQAEITPEELKPVVEPAKITFNVEFQRSQYVKTSEVENITSSLQVNSGGVVLKVGNVDNSTVEDKSDKLGNLDKFNSTPPKQYKSSSALKLGKLDNINSTLPVQYNSSSALKLGKLDKINSTLPVQYNFSSAWKLGNLVEGKSSSPDKKAPERTIITPPEEGKSGGVSKLIDTFNTLAQVIQSAAPDNNAPNVRITPSAEDPKPIMKLKKLKLD